MVRYKNNITVDCNYTVGAALKSANIKDSDKI